MRATRPPLRLLWSCVLAPPFAWAAALGLLFTLTDEACRGAPGWLVATGILSVAVSVAAGLTAWSRLRRTDDTHDDGDYVRFLLALGIGSALVFTLVILLSMVPIFLLSPCPT